MKINNMLMSYSVPMIGLLFLLSQSQGYALEKEPVEEEEAVHTVYLGVFGGGGVSSSVQVSQYGSAFFSDAMGGTLAVNAFGSTNHRSVGLIGGMIGYQWPNKINYSVFPGCITPALELEGYYLGESTFRSDDIINETSRLAEHDFEIALPMSTSVFLTNAVLNFNSFPESRWHPYLGGGIGAGLIRIRDADALQTAPLEAGINHFNGNTNDKDTTFAAQIKLGLNVDVCSNTSLFVEYRWLYLGNSDYRFGSTVDPSHAPTSPWLMELDRQYYNMGAVGLHYSI